jgi:hypothetical protein
MNTWKECSIMIKQKFWCARLSWHTSEGSSPSRAKLSKQPVIYVAFKEVTN